MTVLGPAKAAPPLEQLIAMLAKPLAKVITEEMTDEGMVDRIWLLRHYRQNYLYYQGLQNFAPAIFQGIIDQTGVTGSLFGGSDYGNGIGSYDYTQNTFKGYCRKEEAVLGTRIPNAVAVPNDPSDEDDIKAARAANSAAMYIRDNCELQVQILWLVFCMFCFGTCFWSIEWVVDGEQYGYKAVPQFGTEDQQMGGGFDCPDCGSQHDLQDPDNPTPPQNCQNCGGPMADASFRPPFAAPVPQNLPPKQVEKGGLEICLLDGTEVSVPLDADGRKGIEDPDLPWVRRERERPKGKLLQKYGEILRNTESRENSIDYDNAAMIYGQQVRSALASPIGIVRPKGAGRWTEVWEDWKPQQYELVDEKEIRQLLKENFPLGLRITSVKGIIVNLENRKVDAHWQECQPEPTKRIIADPLGDDWIVATDIGNNLLNQQCETVERNNEPGFADPTRVDIDAWQRRRDQPGDLIPALPPAGKGLADIIFRPPPLEFSEQIPALKNQVEQTAQQNSGLLEVIWGGDTSDPTARQTELKTNAAIRQLSVVWVMIGKSLEGLYEKACALLAEHEDGVLSFSKQKANEFGKFDTVAVVIEDLKGGSYHFEADEAIPMTWGQSRDLAMWLLDKPPEILKAFGFSDPMNIFEIKNLLGIPGIKIPHLTARDKVMDIISRLLQASSVPGPVGQDGKPGPRQSSIQPAWEDDFAFNTECVKSYLETNFELAEQNPTGYENVQLYGQACEAKANVPAAAPPPKASIGVTLKGADLGDPAVTASLVKAGVIPLGTAVAHIPVPLKPGEMAPPGPPQAPPPGAVQ